MFRLMPGDPSTAYIDPNFTGEQRQLVLQQFGLDKPLSEQYLIFLKNTAQGEFGLSSRSRQPVPGLVVSVLPNTLLLTMTALFVAYAFGGFFGALLAWKRGSVLETVSIPIVLTTRAMPDFWLGMLILAIFAFGLGWFPSGGANAAGASFSSQWGRIFSLDFLRHLSLPCFTLAIFLQGLPVLPLRSNMLDLMRPEFITMARMQSLPQRRLILRHPRRHR